MPGRTSSDGGSTTSKRLMRWPPPSTPCRPCGQARAGTRSRRSRPSAPNAATGTGNKGGRGGIRVSAQVRGAVQQESWYLVSAQYLSNRSALAPDPADAGIDDLRPRVEDQATAGRQQFARAQRPSPAAREPL